MKQCELAADRAQELLEQISDWGNVTVIIIHGGSVFEFKGPFPKGSVAEGYYNLKGAGEGEGAAAGFEGHLKLDKIATISLQEKPHRGKDSYSLVFINQKEETVFKIFLGREADGEIIASQLATFRQLQNSAVTA
ncbi:MAG: heme utilization cystosolic carrier protein HutX [Pseudomonadales bacterium]|nr:heme utilization cystosolic carrier protein HutX [Pseudomonadales bacterium]